MTPARTAQPGLRATTTAWRELLRTSTELMRWFEETGDFGDLTVREYDVLRALAESRDGDGDGGARLGRLAEVTYLPQPSMSRLVERLERRGLVSRCSAPQDGRGVLVRLTPRGREVQAAVGRRHVRSIHQAMAAGLDAAQLETLTALLATVRRAQHTPPAVRAGARQQADAVGPIGGRS